MTKKIEGFTEDMGGEYVCRASNVKGHSKDAVNIIVTGKALMQLQTFQRKKILLYLFVIIVMRTLFSLRPSTRGYY